MAVGVTSLPPLIFIAKARCGLEPQSPPSQMHLYKCTCEGGRLNRLTNEPLFSEPTHLIFL